MKILFLLIALACLATTGCDAKSTARAPTRADIAKTWMGAYGDSPVIMNLGESDSYVILPGKNGVIRSFTITSWSLKDYALRINFDQKDLDGFSMKIRGSAVDFRIHIFLQSDFFVDEEREIILCPIESFEKQMNEGLRQYREKKTEANQRLQTMRFRLPMNAIAQGPHV